MMQTGTLQNGDLLFCSGLDLFGRLIEAVSKSKWSHVGILWKPLDAWMVLEAREGHGVRLVPLSWYGAYHGEVWAASVNNLAPEQETAVLTYGLSKLGDPYDWAEIGELAFHFLSHIQVTKAAPDSSFVCSVFAQACFHQAGLPLTAVPVVSPSEVAASKLLVNWRCLKGVSDATILGAR